MGAKDSKYSPKDEIICPQCPLTPIITFFLDEGNMLTCEYRCPNLHFGTMPFSDIFKSKYLHGNQCDRCKKNCSELEKELLYCQTCKNFICVNCRPVHDKEKESHKILIKKSGICYTCLQHNKNIIGYCFSCLLDICPECKRHNKHVIKTFEEIRSNYKINSFQNVLNEYNNYISNFQMGVRYNKLLLENYKKRNSQILYFVKYLEEHLDYRTKSKTLNSEILINYLNMGEFDFNANNRIKAKEKYFEKFCQKHLIVRFQPLSYICNFSKNKQDFNINRLKKFEYYFLQSDKTDYFKYSPIGEIILFASGASMYLLPTNTKDKNIKINTIKFESKIYSFNIINKNILCVLTADKQNIFVYKLIKNPPYYKEEDFLLEIEIPLGEVFVQIIANINKYIVTRALKGTINLHLNKKEKYEVVASYKPEQIIEQNKYELKGIWNDYLIIRDDTYLVVRDLTKKKLDKITRKPLFEYKSSIRDLLVYNGNIITFIKKYILFFNLPDLELVSRIELSDHICSVNIVNPRTMIVVEYEYIEQLEVNTWKILWRKANFLQNKYFMNFLPIGAGKNLFLYNKEDNKIYYTSANK